MLLGILIDVSSVQPWKALFPINVTLSEMMTDVSPVHL